MFMVKAGDEPYKGIEVGFWREKSDAIECAKRFMKQTEMEDNWIEKEEGIWMADCYWIHVIEVKEQVDLF